MEAGPKPIRLARLLWPLVLGLGLAVGLLLAFAPRPAVEGQAMTPGFTVDLFHDRVWGKVGPGELVTITGPGGVYGAAQANATGFFWTPLWDGTTGSEAAINDGDVITVYVNGSFAAAITARDVTGQVDVLNDRVVGHIPGISTPTAVTVTLKESPRGEPLPGAPQATTTTDSSGNFTATFTSVDIAPHYWATVDYAAGSFVRDHLAPAGVFVVARTWGGIFGFAEPGQVVTVTVAGGSPFTATADPLSGSYWIAAGSAPGDLVEVDLGGSTVISTAVAALTATVDPTTDLVSGIAPAGVDVRVIFWRWTDDEYRWYEVITTASGSGVYTANIGSVVDLWPSDWLNITTADGEGDETLIGAGAPFIQVWDSSSKNRVEGRVDGPGLPVTVTLDTGTDIHTAMDTSAADASFSAQFPDNIQAGHVVTIESPTWSDSMSVADIALGFDVDNDQVTGESPAGHAEVEVGQWGSWAYPINGSATQAGTLTSLFTVTLPDFDLRFGGWINYSHFNNDGHQTIAHSNLPHVQVEMPHGVGGRAVVPDEGVAATLYYSDGVTVKAWTADDRDSDPDRFWFDDWGGEQIMPGDWVTVTGASGWEAGVQVVDLTVAADEATDRMWGQAPVGLLYAHWDNHPGPDGREEFMPTGGAGNYLIDWSAYGVDVEQGHHVRPYYTALNGNQVARDVRWPQMRVNYGDDWVGGDYEAGHTFWITVTHSIGAVKATVVMSATPGGGWGGDGFETEWDDWSPEQPDMEPGDWAYFQADDGYSNAIHVGTITGELDIDGDTVSGTINASWFTQTLNVRCEVWAEEGAAGIDTTADPDGGSYFCDFGDVGWDLLPGQSVAVHYFEPDDGDRVINVFEEPVPHLRIDKGADGNPTEGGNFAFNVEYWNDGDGNAENTVITDTMLGGMTYITDSSSFTHSGSGTPGDPIIWDLGSLPANSSGRFVVFVQVTAAQSGTITNTVEIATSSPYDQGDPGEKVSMRSAHVEANDTHLDVGKGAWTGDPAPGTDVVFNVNVCNNGSTNSSQVILTDTLHPSMTLQTWWGQHPGWTEVASSSHLLVVSRPSIPGWWCGEVYLGVHLDAAAWPGMHITNTAAISASNDMEEDDNEAFWDG
jgi:uncharacterized repeat protein (TIGR01451 family)